MSDTTGLKLTNKELEDLLERIKYLEQKVAEMETDIVWLQIECNIE